MISLKRKPSVVSIKPSYLRTQDAMVYVGVGENLFKQMVSEHRLNVYSYGKKIVWYSTNELDKMIEKNILITSN